MSVRLSGTVSLMNKLLQRVTEPSPRRKNKFVYSSQKMSA